MTPQELITESKILDAIAEGAAENLPGRGQPLNLSGYFETPAHLRMAFSILKSADVVPEELALLEQINALQFSHDAPGADDAAKRSARLKISELTALYEMKMRRYQK